jgi:hypothetical protein
MDAVHRPRLTLGRLRTKRSNTLAVDHHLRIAEALLLARAKASTLGQTANAGENIRRLQLLAGGWRDQDASHQKV